MKDIRYFIEVYISSNAFSLCNKIIEKENRDSEENLFKMCIAEEHERTIIAFQIFQEFFFLYF